MKKYISFNGMLIMEGRNFHVMKEELHRQIDMLLEWDGGLAQPCHCEFHDPEQCQKDRFDDERQREELANNIKMALNL